MVAVPDAGVEGGRTLGVRVRVQAGVLADVARGRRGRRSLGRHGDGRLRRSTCDVGSATLAGARGEVIHPLETAGPDKMTAFTNWLGDFQ